MSHSRTEISDETEGLNADMTENVSITRKAMITQEAASGEPMQAILRQIQQKIINDSTEKDDQTKPKYYKTLDPELINEYAENHVLLSSAFPHIFPFGLSEKIWGTASVPKDIKETWMLFYDHRCAEEIHLIFLLFDQLKRHGTNSAVSYKIKTGAERESLLKPSMTQILQNSFNMHWNIPIQR